MNKTSSAGLSQNSASSHSTLRPRNARLISYLEEDLENDRPERQGGPFSISSKSPQLSQVREDVPSSSLSPRSTVNKAKVGEGSKNHSRTLSTESKSSTSNSLWDSFSQLQGIASTLLGSDVPSATRRKSSTTPCLKPNKTFTSPIPTADWGPTPENISQSPAQDAAEERKALVQAKRREALLLASTSESRDALGKYKRRDSDTDSIQTKLVDIEDEALVYIHKVRAQDTLPGVMIKYSCEPGSFKESIDFGRMTISKTRSHVFLPLEACSVRGKKIDVPHHDPDLLDPELDNFSNGLSNSNKDASVSSASQAQVLQSAITSEPASLLTSLHGEEDYKHDSWVLIPSFNEPIQIVPHSSSFTWLFSTTSEKSNSAYVDKSTNSTPRSSFDMLRHPPTHAAQQNSLSLNASPVRRPKVSSQLHSGSRQRSSSTTMPRSSFAHALRGPGGVGTLRGLRTEISKPGPEDDPLNRKFAQYLPDLAPPEDMPRLTLRPTPRATPRASTDSVRSYRSNSSGIGDIGGTMEGWVRKFAGTAAKRDRGNGTGSKMGDVIELETNSSDFGDLGTDFDDLERTPTATNAPSTGSSSARNVITATEEAMLNERFPIRGRVRNAYGLGQDKDKDD